VFGDVTFAQSPFASLGGATFGVDVSEAAVAANTQSVEVVYGGIAAEAAAALEAQSAIANMFASQNEIALAESIFDTLNNIFNVDLSESAVGQDANSAVSTLLGAIAEAATGEDAFISQADFAAAIAELGLAFDEFTAGKLINAALAEGATGSDVYQVVTIFGATVAESVVGSDEVSAVKEINARITGIQLYVNIGNALIWAVIDDTQSANWQNINNVQGSGWTNINDEQTPGWTNIPS
jgi:hypothetical protein